MIFQNERIDFEGEVPMALEVNDWVSPMILRQIRMPANVIVKIEVCPIDILNNED